MCSALAAATSASRRWPKCSRICRCPSWSTSRAERSWWALWTRCAAAGALERSLFVTGNVEALRLLRGLSGEARIGLTWLEGPEPPAGLLRELGAEYWNPMFDLVTRAGVDAVHAQGRKVSTWTVDRSEDVDRVLQAGVDAVVSNRIGDLLRFLGRG